MDGFTSNTSDDQKRVTHSNAVFLKLRAVPNIVGIFFGKSNENHCEEEEVLKSGWKKKKKK